MGTVERVKPPGDTEDTDKVMVPNLKVPSREG
jgi:hypothetical protein